MRKPSNRVLIQTCQIYVPRPTQDRSGGYVPSYPASPTYRDVPCSAQPGGFTEEFDQGVLVQRKEWRLILKDGYRVANRTKIVFTDAANVSHTLYVMADRDEAGRGAAYSIKAIERI